MNIRKTLLAGALSLGLLGSIAAPAALAANDNADVVVVVGTGGAFSVVICNGPASIAAQQPVAQDTVFLDIATNPSASTAGAATGEFGICYWDDLSYRPAFDTTLVSSDFVNQGDPTKTIDASNFKIVFTSGVAQAQSTNFNNPNNLAIGDIGYYVNQLDPYGQAAPPAGGTWTGSNALNAPAKVHFGYAGVGTIMSGGQVDVNLTLPIGTAPGVYLSEITVDVLPDPNPLP
ncbi:MAG: hypothetical protein IT334_07525 [Thermomicrobiales bacterium]|nr:hypothetical protein [Thermomicrobiales bacterium]